MAELYVPEDHAIGRARFSLSGDPQEMVWTIGLKDEFAMGADALAEHLDQAITGTDSFVTATTDLFSGWSYLGTSVSLMTATGFASGEFSHVVVGSQSGETPPVNVAILVKKNTSMGGRFNRGRMYLPPYSMAEGSISKLGVLDPTQKADLQDRCDAFYGILEADVDVDMRLLHYPRTADPTPDPTPLTSLIVDNIVATQRRRLSR